MNHKNIAKIIVFIGFIIIAYFVLVSCNDIVDYREHYIKERYFKVTGLKTSGKRVTRGFYVEGNYERIRFRNIRESNLKIGDYALLQYDSIVDKNRSVIMLDFPFRINNLKIK